MAFIRPVTATKISTTLFGHHVYDWITANTPTAWTTITLINGYTHYPGIPTQYRRVGDVVSLRGRMVAGSAGASAFIMPVGFRTPVNMVPLVGVTTGGNWVTGPVDFRADGNWIPFGVAGTVDVANVLSYSTTA